MTGRMREVLSEPVYARVGDSAVVQAVHQCCQVDDGQGSVAQLSSLSADGDNTAERADGDAEHCHHHLTGDNNLAALYDDVLLQVFYLKSRHYGTHKYAGADIAYHGDIRAAHHKADERSVEVGNDADIHVYADCLVPYAPQGAPVDDRRVGQLIDRQQCYFYLTFFHIELTPVAE